MFFKQTFEGKHAVLRILNFQGATISRYFLYRNTLLFNYCHLACPEILKGKDALEQRRCDLFAAALRAGWAAGAGDGGWGGGGEGGGYPFQKMFKN